MSIIIKKSKCEEIQCLDTLRSRMNDDKDLENFSSLLPDKILLNFIRGRKYNEEYAFTTLKTYMALRTLKYREFFIALYPSHPSQLRVKDNIILPLKSNGPNGELIIVSRFSWFYHSNFDRTLTFDDLLGKLVLLAEEAGSCDAAQFNKVSVVIDFKGFTYEIARELGSYNNLMKLIHLFYKSVPLSYREIHYLHTPFSVKMIHNLAKTLLPAKFLRRIHIHKKPELLHEHLPPSILPESMEGELREEDAYDYDLLDRVLKRDDYYQQFSRKLKSLQKDLA